MDDLAQSLFAFVKAHENWAGAVLFAIAFTESSAVVSLVFPGVTLLIAAGTLIEAGALPSAPVIVGAILGAAAGAAVSYVIGRAFGDDVSRLWPFSRNVELLPAGIRFFRRHGGKSVFIGRFYGPIRGIIPLVAGLMLMPQTRFWIANLAASLVWAPMLLLVGDVVADLGDRVIGSARTVMVIFAVLTLFALAGVLVAVLRARRNR